MRGETRLQRDIFENFEIDSVSILRLAQCGGDPEFFLSLFKFQGWFVAKADVRSSIHAEGICVA